MENKEEIKEVKKFPLKWLFLSILFACIVELIFLKSDSIFYQLVILNYQKFCVTFLDSMPPILSRLLLLGFSVLWGVSWWFAFNSKKEDEKKWIASLCILPFFIGTIGLHLLGLSFFYSTLVVIGLFILLIIVLTMMGVPLLF